MTKQAAIQAFFEGFGLSAFPSVSVPTSGDEMPDFPYLTYDAPTDSDTNIVSVTASLWYRGESWVAINAKTEQISKAVGTVKQIFCDDGGINVRKGSPFATPMGDPSDDMIKRKLLQFEFSYWTV